MDVKRLKEEYLLLADAIINLMLGLLLLVLPRQLFELLGVPIPENRFYSSILGAVLLGIALALIIEYSHEKTGCKGLGIGGAIAINICGAGVLVIWLLFGSLDIPTRGYVFLWSLALLIFGISLVELFSLMRRTGEVR